MTYDFSVTSTASTSFQTEALAGAFVAWPVCTVAPADWHSPPPEAHAPWARPSPDARRLLAEVNAIAEGDFSQLPGAVPPCPRAWRDARTFILNLPKSLVHLPNIGVAADGEVNFLWKHNQFHIDLGFYGSGTFSYYARDEMGQEYFGDARSATDGLPTEVAAMVLA